MVKIYDWDDYNALFETIPGDELYILMMQYKDEKCYYIRLGTWGMQGVRELAKLVNMRSDKFLRNIKQFNYLTHIYMNRPNKLDVFFNNKEDAIAVVDWIESQRLATYLAK